MNESWKKTSSCQLLEAIYDEIVPYSVVYFLICKFSMLLFLYQVIANTSAFYNYKTMHDYANMVKTVCRRIVSLHEHLCSFLKRHHTYGDMEHLQIYSMFGFTCFLNPTRNMWEFPLFFCNEGIQNTILPTKSALCSLCICVHLITYLSSFQSVAPVLLVNHRENYNEREWNCVSGLSNAHMKVRVLSFTYLELTDKIIVLIIYNRILWSIHAM